MEEKLPDMLRFAPFRPNFSKNCGGGPPYPPFFSKRLSALGFLLRLAALGFFQKPLIFLQHEPIPPRALANNNFIVFLGVCAPATESIFN